MRNPFGPKALDSSRRQFFHHAVDQGPRLRENGGVFLQKIKVVGGALLRSARVVAMGVWRFVERALRASENRAGERPDFRALDQGAPNFKKAAFGQANGDRGGSELHLEGLAVPKPGAVAKIQGA